MNNWTQAIGNLAVFWTIGLFLCGIQICYKIYMFGKVGDISALPFLTACINCVIAFLYGFLINNVQIIVVNIVGFILESFYLIFYLIYTPNKKKLLHQVIFLVIITLVVCLYIFLYEKNSQNASYAVGYMTCIVGVIMFGSPLASIKNVMKTRSTESLSFPLCLANFVCASLWSMYGLLLDDYFIMIPNLIGSLLGFAQVSLFSKFPSLSIVTRSKLKTESSVL